MKEIVDYCDGWIETEEEPTLKNHLRRARIKVKGLPDSIPRTVEIEHEGYYYTLPLWVEIPARVRQCLSKNTKTGPSKPYAKARAREVQSLGRAEGLNFKHLTRGEESADTFSLKEV